MNSFIVRIELHGASYPAHYTTLHTAMQREGFVRTIVGTDGKSYYLPSAEYLKTGNFQLLAVMQSAERAAKLSGWRYSILGIVGQVMINNLMPVA